MKFYSNTYADKLSTYLVIGLGAGEVETGVALLVDEEVGEVNLRQVTN